MTNAFVEHTNLTVENPEKAAELFCRLFDWKTRWSGASIHSGHTVHVGSETSYLALYTSEHSRKTDSKSYEQIGGLNHIGLVVDDLDQVEQRVRQEGLEPYNFGDYEPGRRFYFDTEDGIEIEVVSYS